VISVLISELICWFSEKKIFLANENIEKKINVKRVIRTKEPLRPKERVAKSKVIQFIRVKTQMRGRGSWSKYAET